MKSPHLSRSTQEIGTSTGTLLFRLLRKLVQSNALRDYQFNLECDVWTLPHTTATVRCPG
jgi:hypothetical protein